MKKTFFIISALVIVSLMMSCKKKMTDTVEPNTVFMTLETSCGDSKTIFDPAIPGFTWNNSGWEYISVGGNYSGYLGQLSAEVNGGDASTTRMVFSGNIAEPNENDTKFYFFYLGNGSHSATVGDETKELNFSKQTGTADKVTDYLVAIAEGEVTKDGDTYKATADLEVKTAIAYIDDSAFGTEATYLYGDDICCIATVNYKDGTFTTNSHTAGQISLGKASTGKYIALLPSGNTATTLYFESNSKINGQLVFNHGIQPRRYYSDDGNALVVSNPHRIKMGFYTLNCASPGLFSVTKSVVVRFAGTNLKAIGTNNGYQNISWDQYRWSFNSSQFGGHNYEISESNGMIYDNYIHDRIVGLFGYNPKNHPNITSTSNSDYQHAFTLFHGNEIENDECSDNLWYVLDKDEWDYLLNRRNGHANKRTLATVNNVPGLLLLPDDWDHESKPITPTTTSYLTNTISDSDWWSWENKGAVFLPAAGQRIGTNVSMVNEEGYYWTHTEAFPDTKAYSLDFSTYGIIFEEVDKYQGHSVRFVCLEYKEEETKQ